MGGRHRIRSCEEARACVRWGTRPPASRESWRPPLLAPTARAGPGGHGGGGRPAGGSQPRGAGQSPDRQRSPAAAALPAPSRPFPPRPASPCLPQQALPLNASLRGTERAEAQKICGNILRPQKEHAGECGWTSRSRALGEVAGLSPRRWETRCTRTCGDPGFFWKGRDGGDSKGPCPPPRGLFPHPTCLPSRSPCLYPPETKSFFFFFF